MSDGDSVPDICSSRMLIAELTFSILHICKEKLSVVFLLQGQLWAGKASFLKTKNMPASFTKTSSFSIYLSLVLS